MEMMHGRGQMLARIPRRLEYESSDIIPKSEHNRRLDKYFLVFV